MNFLITPRAAGKTTYLLDRVYREKDCKIVTAWEVERHRLIDLLAQRCLEDGPPPWVTAESRVVTEGFSRRDWVIYWDQRGTVETASSFRRGGPRKVLIDNVDHVLSVLFGEVEEATATAGVRRKVPGLPRIKCADCGAPYDEDNDALGLCADCLAKDEHWDE